MRTLTIAAAMSALVIGTPQAVGALGSSQAVGARGSSRAVGAPSPSQPIGARCIVPGRKRTLHQLWRPDMRAAIAYAHSRIGNIAFAVRTQDYFWGYRPDTQLWSASVLKAMLLVAYLDMPSVVNRALTSSDTSLLTPMIEISDNNAANQVDVIVGNARLSALAARVGMSEFVPTAPIWGESLITARDQTKFFLHIDSFIVPRHRAYALQLLNSVTPSQRWGVGQVAPKGWKLYFKGGWGSGTGLIDNQVALFTRGCARVSIAVLTMDDGSHNYGKETLRQIFWRLLRRLPTGRHTRYR
jgi:beta-lactamase class A